MATVMEKDRVTLLAFDFDGTIAPICDDPATVKLSTEVAEFLYEAAEAPGVVLAVASGRDADDLASRFHGIPAYLIASHGLEIRGPYGRAIRNSEPLNLEVDRRIRKNADLMGFRLEHKTHGIALHWRGVPYLHDRHPLVDAFRRWAAANDLEIIEGRCVVEARRRGAGKEEALRWVTSATAARRVIFAGDDITDFGALQFAADHGRALFVRSSERTPPPGVTIVESFHDLVQVLRDEVAV